VTLLPERASLDARPVPGWYTDAKLGIFVHWGLHSIPAFAEADAGDFATYMRDLAAGKDTKGRVPYAEWYLNALRVPGSATARYHEATYGKDFSYFDLQARFDRDAEQVDFADWAGFFARAGARYVVMVTRHLDGYPLRPTTIANPHMSAAYRSQQDLVGDLAQAVREQGLRMGLYYGGGMDWAFTDKPIRTMADLMSQQALGAEYARPRRRAVDRADRRPTAYGAVERRGLARGVRPSPTHGPLLRHRGRRSGQRPVDLGPGAEQPHRPRSVPAVRHSGAEGDGAAGTGTALTGTQLVHLLVDVVANGGNLLINVGPDGTGRIPDLQQQPLRELGGWLDRNGEAIYATRRWTPAATTTATGDQVRFTHRESTVYAIVLADLLTDDLTIRGLTLPPGSRLGVLGGAADLARTQAANDVRITPPTRPPGQHAQVLRITTS
jgi:alpha-L-fucosidase